MANTIATAVLEIATDTGKMSAGLNAAAADVRTFGAKIEASTKGISAAWSAMTKAMGVLAIASVGKEFLDFAGDVSDLSQRLQVSTDTVQEWRATFGKAGVPIESVAKSSEILSEKINGGDKSAVGALKAMGFSIAELQAMKPEDRFIKVADAVGQLQNQDDRIAASKGLFGKGGPELLAALDGHLAETIDQIHEMGLVIDGETIKAADDFGDQLGLMGKQLLGIVATVVGPLLPALSALGSALSWLGREVIGPVLNVAVKSAMWLLYELWERVSTITAAIAEQGAKLPVVGKYFQQYADMQRDVSAKMAGLQANLWKSKDATDAAGNAAPPAARKIAGLGDASDDAAKKHKKQAEALAELARKVDELNRLNAQGLVKPAEYNPAAGELPELARIRAFLAAMAGMKVGPLQVAIDAPSLEASIAGAGALGIETIGIQLEKVVYQRGQSAFSRITQGIPQLLQQAFTGGGGWKGFGQALSSQIGEALGGKLFTAGGPLNGLGNKLAGLFGDSFGLALPGIGQALGALVGPIMAKVWDGLKRAFGGPSKQELEGRDVVKQFEGRFRSTEDMINAVGAAYVAHGKSAQDAQAAIQRLWAAEKRGAEATRAALAEINAELDRQNEIADAIHAQGFQSQDEIRHEAEIANAAFEEMQRRTGQFTDAQISQAYRHYQELLAQLDGAAGEAARAWLAMADSAAAGASSANKAMDELKAKQESLAQSIANEAPEEVMGVIEAQTRGQIAALAQQMKDQQEALQQASETAADTTTETIGDATEQITKDFSTTADDIADVFDVAADRFHNGFTDAAGSARIDIANVFRDFSLTIPVHFASDSMPSPGRAMAAGGFGRVYGPTSFLAGEAGAEDVVFGGAGRNLARDVATELAQVLPNGSSMPIEVVLYHTTRLDGQVVAEDTTRRIVQGKGGLDRIWQQKFAGART